MQTGAQETSRREIQGSTCGDWITELRDKANDLGEVFCGGEEPCFNLEAIMRTLEIALK